MAEQESQPATRLVVNAAKFRELAAERGLKNVDMIIEKARQEGKQLAGSTVYSILGNGNFTRDSIERLAEVVGVPLEAFVSFETLPEGPRRG